MFVEERSFKNGFSYDFREDKGKTDNTVLVEVLGRFNVGAVMFFRRDEQGVGENSPDEKMRKEFIRIRNQDKGIREDILGVDGDGDGFRAKRTKRSSDDGRVLVRVTHWIKCLDLWGFDGDMLTSRNDTLYELGDGEVHQIGKDMGISL